MRILTTITNAACVVSHAQSHVHCPHSAGNLLALLISRFMSKGRVRAHDSLMMTYWITLVAKQINSTLILVTLLPCAWSKGVLDVNELRNFLVVITVMGLVWYPQIESLSTMWPYSNPHLASVSVHVN